MAGALSSLKIVEVGEMVSAPYCSKLLADMGADVIKVERVPDGDDTRRFTDHALQRATLGDAANVRTLFEPAVAVEAHLAGRVVHQNDARQGRVREILTQPFDLFFR